MPASFSQIRLIRRNAGDVKHAAKDDLIRIRRDGEQFQLTYIDADRTDDQANTLALNGQQLFRYVRALIRALESDEDPFESVQIDFQAAPSIYIDTKRLARSYHWILDLLEIHMDNPVSTTKETRGDVRTADEDEFADLPPLIPMSPVYPKQAPGFGDNTPLQGRHLFFDEN
jgi:hypothetical protein